ncbi:MAG: phosphonate C-P lyase system protein PhnH [Desulfovibrionales bacterium]
MLQSSMPTLLPGFDDPVVASQQVFRTVLKALSRPGTVLEMQHLPESPAPLLPASAAVLLCLADGDTPIWLNRDLRTPELERYLRFHCGASLVHDPDSAVFGCVSRWDQFSLPEFTPGDDLYPDRSATLILQVSGLEEGRGKRLMGPGIATDRLLHVEGVGERFWKEMAMNRSLFPLGVDVILATRDSIAGLPRTIMAGK